MKNTLTICFLLTGFYAFAQTPGISNYLYINVPQTTLANLPASPAYKLVLVTDSNHRLSINDGTSQRYLPWMSDLALSNISTLQQVINSEGGGTSILTKNDTVDGGAHTLYLGKPASAMTALSVNASSIALNGQTTVAGPLVTSGIVTAPDANSTVSYGSSPTYGYILPTVTANRTLTLPSSPPTGWHFVVFNRNTSGSFTWSFASGVVDATGASITTMTNATVYELIYDGTNYVKIN